MIEWLILTIILMVIITIPVKIAAVILGGKNTGMAYCALAVVLGIIASMTCLNVIPGTNGIIAAYLSVCVVYWLILRLSFIAALLLPVVIVVIQIAVMHGLAKLGLVGGI